MIKMVRFGCGCIGTKPVDGKTCIISRDNEECIGIGKPEEHNPVSKEEKDLTDQQANDILELLDKLIRDGYRYRMIKNALRD